MDTSSTPDGRLRASFLAAAGLTALLGIAAVWCVDYLPTNDGPRHVFAIHAANRLDDAATGYGDYFEVAHPITSLGFAALYSPLDRLLPWRTALKLALSLMVLLWTAGTLLFVRAVHSGRGWLGIALAGAAFQWSLYMGLFPFYVATAFGFFVLAIAFRAAGWSTRRRLLLAFLLLVQALFHVAAAMITGTLLTILALSRSDPSRRLAEGLKMVLMGMPSAAIAVVLVAAGANAGGLERPGAVGPWPELWTLGRCFATGPPWRAWPLTLLALAAPALLLSTRKTPLGVDDRALLIFGGLAFAASIGLPLHVPSWEFLSVRCVPMAVCALVAAIPLERLTRAEPRRAALLALFAYALFAGGWAIHYNRDLEARSASALSGLRADIARDGPRLPIVLDRNPGRTPGDAVAAVPYAGPLANLGHLYATAQGGVMPYNFAVNPLIHHLSYVDEWRLRYPPIPRDLDDWAPQLAQPEGADVQLRAAILTHAGSYGSFYQDIILWGRPGDGDLLIHRGYAPDWREGGLLIAHFEGCPLTLSLPEDPLVREDTLVELGWYPLTETARRFRVSRDHVDASGRIAVPLAGAPCGSVWIRLASRGGSSGPPPCAGADPQGRLVIPSTRATPVARCDWSDPR